jgi:hypothetical protein
VQVGAQRIVGETLLPQTGRQFCHARCGMQSDALKHVDEIGIRIDAVQSARDDQALDYSDISPARATPVFAVTAEARSSMRCQFGSGPRK